MALSPRFRDQILARLSPVWQEKYAAGEITDAHLEQFAGQVGMEAPADFSGVRGDVQSTLTERQPPRELSPLDRSIALSGLRDIAGRVGTAADIAGEAAVGGAKASLGGYGFAEARGATGPDLSILDPLQALLNVTGQREVAQQVGALESALAPTPVSEEEAKRYYLEGTAQREAATQRARRETPLGETLSVGLAQAAGSPSSLASILGGPTAVIPFADVYGQEYTAAILAGATEQEARARAATQAGIEGAVEAVPFKLGKLGAFVPEGDIARFGTRMGARVLGEAASEGATTVAQTELDRLISNVGVGSEALQTFAKANTPQDAGTYVQQVWESMVAGGLGAGAVSSPVEAMRIASERGFEVGKNLELANKWKVNESKITAERTAAAEQERVREEQQIQQEAEIAKRRARLDPEMRAMAQSRLNTYKGRLAQVQQEILDLQSQIPTQDQLQEREALGEGMAEMPEVEQFNLRRLQSARDSRQNLINAIGEIEGKIREDDILAAEETEGAVQESLIADRREGARKEAEERLAKKQEDLVKRVRRDHGRQRSTALRGFEQQAMALPEDQRSDFLADKIGEWDEQNAVEKAVADAQAKSRNVVPAPRADNATQQRQMVTELRPDSTPDQVDEAVEAAQPDGQMTVEQLIAANNSRIDSLASTPTQDNTSDLNMQNVMAALRDTMGKGDSRVLNKLMRDGNLVVVSDASFIPDPNAQAVGAAGYYDGKTTYVVANKLDKDNIVGSMLDIAAHEIKHGADVTEKVTLGGFVGKKNNKELVKKIEALGKMDPDVQAVVNHAKANSDEKTYELELPAYFIQYARGARANRSLVGRVAGNIVSAVRTAAKDKLGNADVNLNDVAYLSDQLLKEVARTGADLAAHNTIAQLPMIMGPKSQAFNTAKQRGNTYQSKDGNEKFVTSDSGSEIRVWQTDRWEELLNGGEVTVEEIFSHGDLFNNYPQLRSVTVKMDPKANPNSAAYYEQAGKEELTLARNLVEGALDEDYATVNVLHDLMIHELQHGIQAIEGFARGGNPSQFRTPEDWKNLQTYNLHVRNLNEFTRYVKSDAVNSKALSPAQKVSLDRLIARHNARGMSGIEFASEAALVLATVKNPDAAMQDWLKDSGIEADLDAVEKLNPEVNKMLVRTNKQYYKLLGEQEAYNVGANRTLRQAELPVNPEDIREPAGFVSTTPVEAGASPYTGESIVQTAPATYSSGLASVPFKQRIEDAKAKVGEHSGSFKALKNALTAFGGLGRELGVKLEDSKNWSVKYSNRAAHYDRRLSRAIDARAKAKYGKNWQAKRKAVSDDINNNLERIADLPLERRESALIGYIRENPDLIVLRPLMADINQMSRTLLDQYLRAHPNPTPAQLKLMNQFHQNAWKYSTRMYEVFQGEAGSKLAERMKKEYLSAEKALADGKAVPEHLRDSYNRWKNAANYLIEHDINIPADMSKTRQGHLDNLYQMHIPRGLRVADTIGDVKAVLTQRYRDQGMTVSDAERAVRDQMIQELEAVRGDVSESVARGKANQIIESMLGLTETGAPIVDYYRGAKQDRTILQTRTDIPPEISELFGKITDPAVRLAVTLAKQAELVGRNQFLTAMKNEGEGKWVIHESQVGQPGTEKFTFALSGENFGMLEGWRTTPEIAAHISDGLEMYSDLGQAMVQAYSSPRAALNLIGRGISGGLSKAASMGKLATIVMDGYNAILNAMGSWIILLQNGVYRPEDITAAGKVSGTSILNTVYSPEGELSEDFEDSVRYGLLDSARAQEIRRTPFKHVQRLVEQQSMGGKAWQYLMGAKDVGVEAFAMTDAWVKIAAFKARTRTLQQYYSAAGINKTIDEIKSEAADVVKDTNIGFSRTPSIVRTAERLGAVTFLPYFWSVYRSIIYSGRQAAKDWETAMKAPTPEAKRIMTDEAIRRTAGLGASTVLFTATLKAIAGALAGEDEEKIEAMKKLMFEDTRFADMIYTGKDEAGVPTFIRLSRVDANGPVTDLLRIAVNDEMDTETKIKAGIEAINGMVFQNRATVAASKVAYTFLTGETVKDKESRGERIFPATAERLENAVTALNVFRDQTHQENVSETTQEAMSAFIPGWFDAFDPTNKAGLGDKGKRSVEAQLGQAAIAFGGKLDKADPVRAMAAAGNKLKDVRKLGRKDVEAARSAGLTNMEVLHRLNKWAEEEHEAALRVQEVYLAMLDSGMTRAQANAAVEESRAIDKQDIPLLISGRNFAESEDWGKRHSRILSEKATEGLNRIGDQKLSEADRVKARKEREEFLQKMKALGYKVQEN